jgi:hypothetical protein
MAPIQNTKIIEDVFARILKVNVPTLTIEELLALAPDLRHRYKEILTPKRVPSSAINFSASKPADVVDLEAQGEESEVLVVPDLAETFYFIQGPDLKTKLRVARESHSLRAMTMTLDRKAEVSCVVDPGCSVISMSDAVSHQLGIMYDPSIRIEMEAANGEVDLSLGLARNVPFSVGEITLFFQVHVIRSPAYDVLLGRPFDVLTESVVKNFRNEEQTITIHDPNSERVVTVPTIPRAPPHYTQLRRDQDFRERSMN